MWMIYVNSLAHVFFGNVVIIIILNTLIDTYLQTKGTITIIIQKFMSLNFLLARNASGIALRCSLSFIIFYFSTFR